MQTRRKQQESSPPNKRQKMNFEHEISLLKSTVDNLDNLVRELMEKVEAQEEQISTLQRFQRNQFIANNHTSIPHSQFKVTIGTTGRQVHWWEQGETANVRGSSKTQLTCSVAGCPQKYGTTYICKDCSTAANLVPVCRPLKIGTKAYEERQSNIAKQNRNDPVNSCWTYHSNCVGRNNEDEELNEDETVI
jgi:hypothetical protein